MEFVLLIVAALAIVIVGAVIVQQTTAKGRFGIDLSRKRCPRCGNPLPMIRRPASREEMLWGGWTCQNCGAKIDKYGRERAT
jgi:hypothetical protein